MLTKTKKWLAAFVLAIVALFLVACGGKEDKPVAPTELSISVDVYVGENAVLVGGEMYLSVQVTPANASKDVNWSSERPEIAVVNQEGKVTGLKGGTVKITATSKHNENVKDEVEITVIDDLDAMKTLIKAMDDVKAKMPRFVAEDFELPAPKNELVTVEYYANGTKVPNNVYRVNYVEDTYVTLECRLAYEGQTVKFDVTFQLVSDLANNDFLILEEAQAAIAKYLQFFKDYKIYENVKLPKTLSELYEWEGNTKEVEQDVLFSWSSTKTQVLTKDGKYTRPNDDTVVRLEVVALTGTNSSISRHDFVVKGYTDDEKVEWILANVLNNIPEEVEGQNIFLPVKDSKFGATITWSSSDAETLATNGKMNPYLEEEKEVTLTATIKYDVEGFAFEREVEFEVNVKPAANDAQKVALALSNEYEKDTFPHWFPWGLEEDNKIPLPTEVTDGEFAGTAVSWTVNEEGLFDANWVIQKQYLRYHEVIFTYSVTVGSNTATGQVAVNVGVAKTNNIFYIGGNMYSRNANQAQPWDELHQLKTDDGKNGETGSDLNVYGWSGYTTYVDIDGVRYQWFHAAWYTAVADDLAELTLTEDDAIQGGLLSVSGHGGTNRQILFVNETNKALKFPVAYHTAEIPEGVTYELGLTKNGDGTTLDRNGIAVDAYFFGMVTDADGKVTWASGDTKIQNLFKEQYGKDEEGNAKDTYVLPDYIEVPAGAFLLATKYAGPTGGLQKIIFKKNLQFTIEKFAVKPQPQA